MTSTQKLAEWQAARPGRAVSQPKRVADAFVCDCTEGGKLVVRGQGATTDAALRDACDRLWRLALEAAGPPSSPEPRWRR